MTPKQTAVLNVVKIFAIGIGAGISIAFLTELFTLEQLGIGVSVALLAYMIKMVYDIELAKAETLAKLNEISKK
jgi:uncharacterized membrane protein YgaE (UPF0421/DUF939 family)